MTQPTPDPSQAPIQTLMGQQSEPAEHTDGVPQAPRGPYGPTIVLGLIALVVAGAAIAYQLGNLSVDWTVGGPVLIIGAGVLLILFGGLGLVRRRG